MLLLSRINHPSLPPLPASTTFPARCIAMAANDGEEWQTLTPDQRNLIRGEAKARRRERRAAAHSLAANGRPNVIIDLGFDELMSDRQVVSLAKQLGHCHAAANKSRGEASGRPALTHCLSSFGGRLEARMQGIHGSSAWPEARHRGSWLDVASASGAGPSSGDRRLIYLSAEGEATVDAIDADAVYVIGGLVDRSQHKDATLRRAMAAGVHTARLPLEEHMAMNAEGRGRALTVNHCFELMLLRAQGRGWEEAMRRVMPGRRREGRAESARVF